MSSASAIFGTKAYVCARYFIRPGKCFKYIDQRGEDATEHVYEVMALYPYCVLLRDSRNGVRTCPGKTMETIQLIRLMLALQRAGTSALMRLQEVK